ncbi:o-succinylbenzoate--CoA ligase [Halobacillus seohaensis]|uniref:2-succinylbenzoate--CoA ligase n=1 Tax=Halobacillus seohaensis TaxID=447421 RepID=A0ABW2ETY5_9BACI
MIEIPHWLDKQTDLQPNATAIELEGRVVTFNDIKEKSQRMASGLINSGVKKGDHLAILAGNRLDFVYFIHAVSYIGAVAVCLNIRLSPREIAYQLEDADVKHVYTEQEHINKASEAAHILKKQPSIIPLGTLPDSEKVMDLNQFLKLDDVFTMMYTSGTTGKPKAVMHTYGNHWFSAVSSALNLGLSTNDKWLVCLPLFHVGGFSLLMKNVVYGMPIVLLNRFDAPLVNDHIMNNNVTLVSLVTVMLQRLLKSQDELYPSTFRGALLGGGPVPEPLLQEAGQANIPVFQSYGMTETSSQIVTLSPNDAFRKLGSAGKALSPASLRVIANDGLTSPNEIGEIHVKGPMVSSGYYQHEPHAEDYLATGDLGYLDEEGFLFVVDRVKDMIISGGENVYPAEIESVLQEIKDIEEAAVTGINHEEWGEVPSAFVVVSDQSSITKEEIYNFCQKRLASYKVPRTINFVSELPRNAANKLVRRNLAQLLDEED